MSVRGRVKLQSSQSTDSNKGTYTIRKKPIKGYDRRLSTTLGLTSGCWQCVIMNTKHYKVSSLDKTQDSICLSLYRHLPSQPQSNQWQSVRGQCPAPSSQTAGSQVSGVTITPKSLPSRRRHPHCSDLLPTLVSRHMISTYPKTPTLDPPSNPPVHRTSRHPTLWQNIRVKHQVISLPRSIYFGLIC